MSRLNNMMEQVKKLKNGVGIQCLVDSAYKILGNPIAMFNTDYTLLAYTDVPSDDIIWNELLTHGTFSQKTQRIFEQEGFIEEVANSTRVALLKSDKIKYDRFSGKIFGKNNSQVSNLVMVASNKPFEEGDQMVFEVICRLLSKEIGKLESYQEYELAHQESIIKNLIDKSYDMGLDVAQVQILYDTLGTNLYITAADVSQGGLGHSAGYFRDLFMKIKPAYKYAVYEGYVIIIASTNDEILDVDKDFRELARVFEQNNIYAGISNSFENLFELRKHYEEALKALQYVLDAKCSQRIFPCHPSALNKMKQINKLSNGDGIQHFLNAGAGIFGNPLLFHDMELNLLAYTENWEITDSIWIELITYGTSSDETIELFRTEGFINTMENTKGGSFLISDKIKYDRISWRIYSNDNIMIGCVSIVNSDNPFSEDELVLFGVFSQKFSKEVGKIEFYNNYGQVYSGTVINRLLSGKIDDYTFYSEDIGNLYDNLMENQYLIAVDTAQCKTEEVNLTYIRKLFSWAGSVNRFAIYGDYLIIILSIDNAPLHKKKELETIGKIFEEKNIFAGVSSCFDNIYELQKYYVEAVTALANGLKNRDRNCKQRIFMYDTST